MLNRISSGWIWLETAINAIIDEVNRQKPLGSASIVVEESPNGALLKVVGNQPTDTAAKPPVPAKPPAPAPVIWHNVAWQQVTVVDPSSCAQSTITVLVQSFGHNITIQ